MSALRLRAKQMRLGKQFVGRVEPASKEAPREREMTVFQAICLLPRSPFRLLSACSAGRTSCGDDEISACSTRKCRTPAAFGSDGCRSSPREALQSVLADYCVETGCAMLPMLRHGLPTGLLCVALRQEVQTKALLLLIQKFGEQRTSLVIKLAVNRSIQVASRRTMTRLPWVSVQTSPGCHEGCDLLCRSTRPQLLCRLIHRRRRSRHPSPPANLHQPTGRRQQARRVFTTLASPRIFGQVSSYKTRPPRASVGSGLLPKQETPNFPIAHRLGSLGRFVRAPIAPLPPTMAQGAGRTTAFAFLSQGSHIGFSSSVKLNSYF